MNGPASRLTAARDSRGARPGERVPRPEQCRAGHNRRRHAGMSDREGSVRNADDAKLDRIVVGVLRIRGAQQRRIADAERSLLVGGPQRVDESERRGHIPLIVGAPGEEV